MNATLSKNIYFTGQNALELKDEPLPDLQAGEVRIKSTKSLISTGTESICFTRNFEPSTHWDNWVKYPFAPGYSLIGEVVGTGPGVELEVGSRVAARRPHHQFVVAKEEALFTIPDGVSDEDASFFALAKIVQGGVRRAEHVLGERVVVIGLGLLGQLVVQYLRLLGAREIIAVDVSSERLELAKAHGATVTLQKSVADTYDDILDLTDGLGADTVYDVTGSSKVLELALPLVKKFGTMVILGDTGKPSEQRLTGHVVTRGLTIVGTHDVHPPVVSSDHVFWSHEQIVQLFFEYVARGDMNVSDLISHRYRPDEAGDAYAMLQTDRMSAMGVVFDWTEL